MLSYSLSLLLILIEFQKNILEGLISIQKQTNSHTIIEYKGQILSFPFILYLLSFLFFPSLFL
jgi:hypothetical protein